MPQEPQQTLVWEAKHPNINYLLQQVAVTRGSLNTAACKQLLQNKHKAEWQNFANADDSDIFNFPEEGKYALTSEHPTRSLLFQKHAF